MFCGERRLRGTGGLRRARAGVAGRGCGGMPDSGGRGTGNGKGTGDRGQGTGDRGQGTGDRGQGTGDSGQGTARHAARGMVHRARPRQTRIACAAHPRLVAHPFPASTSARTPPKHRRGSPPWLPVPCHAPDAAAPHPCTRPSPRGHFRPSAFPVPRSPFPVPLPSPRAPAARARAPATSRSPDHRRACGRSRRRGRRIPGG